MCVYQNIGNGMRRECVHSFIGFWVERNERKSNFPRRHLCRSEKTHYYIETMFPKRSHETELAKGRYILQSMKTTTK